MQSFLASNSDTIVLGLPMMIFLCAGVFQIDKSLAQPPRPVAKDRGLSNWDAMGMPLCVEPDGQLAGRIESAAL